MQKKINIAVLAFLSVVTVVLAALLFSGIIRYDRKSFPQTEKFYEVAIEGKYSEEGGPWQELTRDTVFDNLEFRDITVRGQFTRALPKGEHLFLKMDHVWVSMKVNGEELFYCGPKDGDGNPTKAQGRKWERMVSPGITETDEIELRFGNLYKNAHLIQFDELLWQMKAGDSASLLFAAIGEDTGVLSVGVILFGLALLLLLASGFCSMLRRRDALPFLWLSFISFSASIWFMTLTPTLTLFIPLPIFLNVLYAFSIQGMVFFLALFFIGHLSGWRRQGVYGFSAALLLLLAFDMIRQMQGVKDLYDAINHFMLFDMVFLVFLLISVYYEMRQGKKKELVLLFKGLIPLLVFACLELINGYIQFVVASVCLGVGMIAFILLEGIFIFRRLQRSLEAEKRIAIMEKELTQNRIAIMLSQIQPHFLYNALLGIQELCLEAPEKAYDALEHFSHYLRGNLDTLSEQNLITFEKECTHVRDYLHLEKMRFEERLQVKWEVQEYDFLIPALTLQPIVENAVRYGVTKKEGGGTVTIRCERNGNDVIITVQDDGDGFEIDCPQTDGKTHTGILNVANRLQMLCNGTLQLKSTKGVGTEVIITLPQAKEPEHESNCS